MSIETFNKLTARARNGIRRSLRNHKYEHAPEGIFLPKEGVLLRGLMVHSLNGGEPEYDTNLVVEQGRNYLLDTALHNQAQIANWYVALFAGNVTPQLSWTAANFAANATEFVAYAETARPAYDEGAAASGAIDNFASKAAFNINDEGTVYGGAIISASGKSATTGKLLAAARFNNARDVQTDDLLQIGYQIALLTPA